MGQVSKISLCVRVCVCTQTQGYGDGGIELKGEDD
jgi:hypothetical protein